LGRRKGFLDQNTLQDQSDYFLVDFTLPVLVLPAFAFIGLPQHNKTVSSATGTPPISSTTTDKPHTSHVRESPLLTVLFAAFYAVVAVFTAMFRSFSIYF